MRIGRPGVLGILELSSGPCLCYSGPRNGRHRGISDMLVWQTPAQQTLKPHIRLFLARESSLSGDTYGAYALPPGEASRPQT